jgi:hypothetical protein
LKSLFFRSVSQTALVLEFGRVLSVGVFWGAALAALQVAAGVFVTCLFLLVALVAAVSALTVAERRPTGEGLNETANLNP